MKWVKRFFMLVAVVLMGAIALAAYSMWKSRRNPDWYKPLAMSEAQIEALAHRAENQLQRLNNMASRAHAMESAAQHGTTAPTTIPAEVLRFREDELNALFHKWSGSYLSEADRKKLDQYFGDPQVHFQDGQIIVAGTARDLGRVISIHLKPHIDEEGHLDMGLSSVYTGELPIPEAVFSSEIAKLDALLENYLPGWQKKAMMDAGRGSNEQTVKAAMSELALNALHHQSASPVFFMKTADQHIDPVKMAQLKVGDGVIMLAVEPLNDDERRDLLNQIQQPWSEVKKTE